MFPGFVRITTRVAQRCATNALQSLLTAQCSYFISPITFQLHMDPITIVGLVANLLDVAWDVFSNLNRFYRIIREARTQELSDELNSLMDMLADVREIVPTTPVDETQRSELESLQYMLIDLRLHITPKSANRVIKGLQWPFRQAQNIKFISKIKHFKTTLNKILEKQQRYPRLK
jgi:hypothetical protein